MAITQRQGGVAQGAAIGATYFGVYGAIGGAVLGSMGLFGSGPNATERRRTKEAEAEQAYGVAEQTYQYAFQGREQAHTSYRKGMASATARFAASGAKMEGSAWDQNRGNLIRKRDEKLADADQVEAQYRAGEAYKIFSKDYRRQYTMEDDGSGTKKSRAGGQMFTNEQRGRMLTFRGGGSDLAKKYSQMLAPGIRAYEKAHFGSKADKDAFRSAMDTRIDAANARYAGQVSIARAKSKAAKKRRQDGGGRGVGNRGR